MSKSQQDKERPDIMAGAAHKPAKAATDDSVSFDHAEAKRLLEQYGIASDKFYPLLEEASHNYKIAMSKLTAPTRGEVAKELLTLANHLDMISPKAELAVCLGIDNIVTKYHIKWARDLSAHLRVVGDVYGEKAEGRPIISAKTRRNCEANYTATLIVHLADFWEDYLGIVHRSDRRVRAYRDSYSASGQTESGRFNDKSRRSATTVHDDGGYSGNKGAGFVQDAAELITGHRPSLQTIEKHVRAARRERADST